MPAYSPHRIFLFLASLQAALAVGLGAFGAHALDWSPDDPMIAVFETAARYQFYHALGLGLVALVAARLPRRRLPIASGWLLLAGTILFCGSLYAMALTGVKWLGAITPAGGACFILGWLLLAADAIGKK